MDLLKRKDYNNFLDFFAQFTLAAKSGDQDRIRAACEMRIKCRECNNIFEVWEGVTNMDGKSPEIKCPNCGYQFMKIDK